MAVLVQQVVDAQYAFVLHTTNPSTGDTSEVSTRSHVLRLRLAHDQGGDRLWNTGNAVHTAEPMTEVHHTPPQTYTTQTDYP